jgi:hypothetical protein
MRLFPMFASLLALTVPTATFACSVVPGYRVPTTLELAERADTILIGTVTGEDKTADRPLNSIRIRPTLLLKGAELPAEVSLHGYLATPGMQAPTRSDPAELRRPNPDALTGGCTRYVFAKGMKLLLFFERKDGELRFAGYPFARVSEDVASDDSLWVKTVRTYVEIAALPEAERRAALIARRDALRARTDDADAEAIAADLDRELAGERTPPRD